MRITDLPTILALAAALAASPSCKKEAAASSVKALGDDGAPRAPDESKPAKPSEQIASMRYHGIKVSLNGVYVLEDVRPGDNTDLMNPDKAPEMLALAAIKTPYMERCEKAGVPLPPPWGDPQWKRLGEIEKTFAGLGTTELWTATFADGLCAALPRIDVTAREILVLGQICLHQPSGNACFWDNTNTTNQDLKVAVRSGYLPSDGTGGDELRENCTNCHRGDNPWIVVPGQLTDTLPLQAPGKPYQPLGSAGWMNPKSEPHPGCDGCHSLPQLTTPYCGIAEAMIMDKVMPQGGGTHGVKEFKAACKKVYAAENGPRP